MVCPTLGNCTWVPCGADWTLVDREDAHTAEARTWHKHYKGYCAARSGGITTYLHREILMAGAGVMVDHISGDKLDNRRCNLRLADRSENQANRGTQRNSSAGKKGVVYHKDKKKFLVRVTFRGKTTFVGYFATLADASSAYELAAKSIHGKWVRR